jgi:hypothetical protein
VLDCALADGRVAHVVLIGKLGAEGGEALPGQALSFAAIAEIVWIQYAVRHARRDGSDCVFDPTASRFTYLVLLLTQRVTDRLLLLGEEYFVAQFLPIMTRIDTV